MIGIACVTAAAQADPNNRGLHGSSSTFHDTISVVQLRVPEKAREQFTKALSEFTKHNFDEALKRTNVALTIAPGFPNALTLRGYLELREQQFDAAENDFTHSIEIDPNFALAYLYHGAVLNRLGKYDEAIISLNYYDERNPTSWETPYELAKSWLGKHDYQHQLEAINCASARGADLQVGPAVHFLRGRALSGLHQYAAARAELQASITPETGAAMATLARQALAQMEQQSQLAAR